MLSELISPRVVLVVRELIVKVLSHVSCDLGVSTWRELKRLFLFFIIQCSMLLQILTSWLHFGWLCHVLLFLFLH
jgi:hypothetical protein